MSTRIYEHIRTSVVGYIALFIALSGTAWASHIGANDIANDAVRKQHIANNAVRTNNILAGEVKNSDIASNSVGESELGFAAVTGPKIAGGAVSSFNLNFDPATQIEADLLVSNDLTPPNTAPAGGFGPSQVHWNRLTAMPLGFLDGVDDTTAGGAPAPDLNCTTCVSAGELVDGASLAELLDDDGTGSGLNADLLDGLSSSAFAAAAHNHDDLYFTETELSTSDGNAPNTGSNRVNWNNLTGVPTGFADGSDDGAGGGASWLLGGNAGTDPANEFLGTTDDEDLHLRAGNDNALVLQPANVSLQGPNLIGGRFDNNVLAGVHSATISGGGRLDPLDFTTINRVRDHGGSIGGGADNQAGDNGTTVTDATYATVGGGSSNEATEDRATVGGGLGNIASGPESTVGGGNGNDATAFNATVGGGFSNTASAGNATVGGGFSNTANTGFATVAGGDTNTASGGTASVGGGLNNTASGGQATVPGGQNNVASGIQSAVAGGAANLASGLMATVGGGNQNTAAGDFSFVAGGRAKNTNAAHDGVFLFADSSNFEFSSTAANEFAVRSTGGARVVTAIDGTGAPTAGVKLDPGDTAWEVLSDRAAKENVMPVSPQEVLRRLGTVPISEWNYRAQDDSIRHIGPMAQDFARAFGLSGDDRTHISPIDTDGVALAAIKGLNERVDALNGGGGASGLSFSPAALAGIVALALTLAAALGAAVALRWNGRLRGGWATS